jgi:hypothetical protein
VQSKRGAEAAQVDRVADAIVALSQFYKNEQVVFLKSLDHILIALGASTELLVSSLLDPELLFSTQPAHLFDMGLMIPFGNRLTITVSATLTDDSASYARTFLTGLSDKISRVEVPGGRGELVLDRLYRGLAALATATKPKDGVRHSLGVNARTAIATTKELRERISEFLKADYRLSSHDNSLAAIPKFLVFQRFIGERGPEVCSFSLESQAGSISVGAELSALVSDLFRTGLTRWLTLPSASMVPLADLFGSGNPDISPSALSAQIHVNGVPWLAFVILFSEDVDARREWALKFYRDILPYFTTNIRAFTELTYLKALGERARELLAREAYDRIPETLHPLACVFPYRRITKISKLKDGHLRVSTGHPLFPGTTVKYVRLDQQKVENAMEHERAASKARIADQSIAIAKTRAQQAIGWAHDVKNWTAPMIPALESADAELTRLLGSSSNEVPALDTLKYVILNARCLNAASLGVQNVLRKRVEAGPENAAQAFLQDLSRKDAMLWIETAFQLLMLVHAKMAKLEGDIFELALDWTPRWSVPDLASVLLSRFNPDNAADASVGDVRLEDLFDKFMFDNKLNVIVAFLREVVQNMKIPDDEVVAGDARLIVRYELEQREDEIALHIRQEHLQKSQWVRKLASGLEKSLSLHVPDGANLVNIHREEISFLNEPVDGGYRVKYHLPISFLHEGVTNVVGN